ncbi:hypothetical protein PV326_012516, partial [Microctonus aethiopoides]
DDEKLEAMNIASNIKNELIKAINEAKWLDVETRNNASHKVMSAKTNIGYPDFYRNDNEITEIFRDLQIGESTYLHNVWKIHRFNAALTLRGTGNKDEHFATWIPVLASTTSSTAFYYALENVIVVSPNRLQRPTIDKTQPSYMNYGRIGFVIGHELGHVFDTLRNSISKDKITKDLLIKTSAENLNKRVNVRLPHRENIADNVGVKMIYYAYKDWSSLHDPEPTLPGLNYTSSQMFWISLASLRCTGRRTPNQYRIIGILSNIPEFSKDFNCPLAQQSNMCITPTCLQAAADIMENMDTSVNPCDNFFKFTCGQFLNSAFTRPDETTASWISDMYEEIVTRLSGLLNSKISENDIKLFRQTKQLYRQCLDRKTLTEQQDKNILDILNKFGGWPVIQQITTTYQDHYPVKNFTNYSDDSLYYNFLIKYAVKLGAEEDRAKKEIMEAIKFESDLLNISSSAFRVIETNKSNPQNFMTIDEMMKQWPTIEWLTYINTVFSMVSDTKKINKIETVIVNYPTFITNFEKFISFTPKRVLINYAFGRAIIDLLQLTNLGSNTIFENKDLEMKDENDWRNCVRQTAD